ncbi:DNA-binding protein [Clostridia bacterium]|nr:DNA-binding protein [Clostridia bacterium]
MELDWVTPEETSKRWGVNARQVQALCVKGKVDGAVKLGRVWLIPRNAPKPADGRAKNGRTAKETREIDE